MTTNELFEKWWAETHAYDGVIKEVARQAYIEGYFKALKEHINGKANN